MKIKNLNQAKVLIKKGTILFYPKVKEKIIVLKTKNLGDVITLKEYILEQNKFTYFYLTNQIIKNVNLFLF